jgi:hypothetical protein
MTITQGNIQICEVTEFVTIFNRGYQPLALLEEVPLLIYRSAFLAPKTYHHAVAKWLVVVLAVVGLAAVGFAVMGLDICIEQVVGFAVMVVGHAVVGIISIHIISY